MTSLLPLLMIMDTGVAFEAGYAHAVNKPVILVSQGDCSSTNAMLIGAAKVLIDNVLKKSEMERLVGMMKFFLCYMESFTEKA